MSQKKPLQRKDLLEIPGAVPHLITYHTLIGRLPLSHKATGKGDVNLYAPEAIQILKDWISRRGNDEQS